MIYSNGGPHSNRTIAKWNTTFGHKSNRHSGPVDGLFWIWTWITDPMDFAGPWAPPTLLTLQMPDSNGSRTFVRSRAERTLTRWGPRARIRLASRRGGVTGGFLREISRVWSNLWWCLVVSSARVFFVCLEM